MYSELFHNKSNSEYNLFGNLIEFIALDQSQKIRGRKRDLLFINEANELYYEDWQQLIFRTQERIVLTLIHRMNIIGFMTKYYLELIVIFIRLLT